MGDGPAERARIGMERPDVAAESDDPYAPICGFEYKIDTTNLPRDARAIRLEATAYAADGRALDLTPIEVEIAPEDGPFVDRDPAAAELRRRAGERWGPVPRLPGDTVHMLVCSHTLAYSGAPLWLFEVIERLVVSGRFSGEVVALQDGPLREDFERAGVPVHVTDGFPSTSVTRYEGHITELMAWARGRFDVALLNTLDTFAGADVVRRLGIPAVWAVHESFSLPMYWATAFPPGMPHPYVRERAEQALHATAAVVFEAEATRRLFVPNADPRRLWTMPYGIELDAIDRARRPREHRELRRRLGIRSDAKLILCLGTIEHRKSQTTLTATFAQVADRYPNAELALVGSTEDEYCAAYQAGLREFAARSGIGSRVRIEPATAEPYAWHAIADVLVCASDVESLPRTILEAMAFETPVVSTRVFGVPEVIADGRTGYLCDVRDAGDLAHALDRVLSATPAEVRAITDAAAGQVRAEHDPADYARDFATLLRGLVGAPRAFPGELLDRPSELRAAPARAADGRR